MKCFYHDRCFENAAHYRGKMLNFTPKQARQCDDCPNWLAQLAAQKPKERTNG